MPGPPYSAGKIVPSKPSLPNSLMVARGNSRASSHSMTWGRISRSANSRTLFLRCSCSSFSWKSNESSKWRLPCYASPRQTGKEGQLFDLNMMRESGKVTLGAEHARCSGPHVYWLFLRCEWICQPTDWSSENGRDRLFRFGTASEDAGATWLQRGNARRLRLRAGGRGQSGGSPFPAARAARPE